MDNMITLPYAIDADRPDREIRPFANNAEFLEEKFREYVLLAERSVLMGKTRRAGNETGGNGNGGTPKEQPFELMRKTAEYENVRKRNGERLLVSGGYPLPFETLARNCGLDDTARDILAPLLSGRCPGFRAGVDGPSGGGRSRVQREGLPRAGCCEAPRALVAR